MKIVKKNKLYPWFFINAYQYSSIFSYFENIYAMFLFIEFCHEVCKRIVPRGFYTRTHHDFEIILLDICKITFLTY